MAVRADVRGPAGGGGRHGAPHPVRHRTLTAWRSLHIALEHLELSNSQPIFVPSQEHGLRWCAELPGGYRRHMRRHLLLKQQGLMHPWGVSNQWPRQRRSLVQYNKILQLNNPRLLLQQRPAAEMVFMYEPRNDVIVLPCGGAAA